MNIKPIVDGLIDNVTRSRVDAMTASINGLKVNVMAHALDAHHKATQEGECTWCFSRTDRHRALFVVNYGDEVSGDRWQHHLCWCCWFTAAFIRTPMDPDKGDNIYGPSHLSRVADCERRSFGRFARYAQLINRWPRRWLEGYLAGSPIAIPGSEDD